MRAILKDDIIVQIDSDGVEVGTKPRDYGIECLRFDGRKLINLNDLDEIWVEQVNGQFILHCKKVGNSQLVQMTYNQRKHLKNDNGTFRIKTQDELLEEEQILNDRRVKASIRTKLNRLVGDAFDRELDTDMLLHILMKVVIEGNSDAKKMLEDYLANAPLIVDIDKVKDKLIEKVKIKEDIYNEGT